jgi:hypothetical protein
MEQLDLKIMNSTVVLANIMEVSIMHIHGESF